jgi:two-component system chemotaxis sensor kinase CheA
MDREALRSFIKTAEAALMSARGSLLLISQGGARFDLAPLAAQLENIAQIAAPLGYNSLASQAARCNHTIREATSAAAAFLALDAIAAVEAELLAIVLPDEIADVAGFVDGSFEEILIEREPPDAAPQFSIDQETLEIFRAEGEELLANISLGIDVLAASPADQNALWDIRRSGHTFKGAAGIVGLSEAASLAHRMEDLLDRLVESHGSASILVLEFLRGCVRSLEAVLDGHPANAAGLELAYSSAVASLNGRALQAGSVQPFASSRDKPIENKRIARVSLDRISEIVALTEQLLTDQREFEPHAREVVADIHDRLTRLRLIRFGNLETRLARAVNLTATEENKKVVLDIETPDVEIDTLAIDGLVEPLLHLIKNAVVHGVEPPEIRRMLGKHEFGLISIRVDADSEAIVVSVSDDGAGIAVDKIKERALERHAITDQNNAAAMSDRDAYRLLFEKGLTTTDTVTLNAGRGIGMSIVKEAIESRGGSIHIESTPQLGTSFTLMLPTSVGSPHVSKGSMQQESTAAVIQTLHGWAQSSSPLLPFASSPLVLIVDDSASIRRHTQIIVEEAGLRAITAKDGAEALELLLNGSVKPDLILSDVEMPHLDGWQLLEYIKTDDNLGHVPVVMVTSLDADNHRATATRLGAADYIVKPFSTNEIERVLMLITESVAA